MKEAKEYYKFDMEDLEVKASNAYFQFRKNDTAETRTDVFQTISDLTYAILVVGKWKRYDIDIDEIAYEYALSLFTRIVLENFKFRAIKGKIAFNPYISQNLKDIVFTKKGNKNSPENELLYDMEFLLDSNSKRLDIEKEYVDPGDLLDRERCALEVFEVLRVFYSKAEIDRMLGLALDIISNNQYQPIPRQTAMPKDLRDFCVVLVCSAKKLAVKNNIINYSEMPTGDVNKSLLACVRSSVFLALVSNTDTFSKEIMYALDIDSLYRLASIAGSKRLKIPNTRELDTLIASCASVSMMIMENKDPQKTLKKVKKDLKLVLNNKINIHHYISKAIEVFDFFGKDKKSESFTNVLLTSATSIEKFYLKLLKRKELMGNQKNELILILNKYINSLTKIKDELEK